MGEAKRKRENSTPYQRMLEDAAKELANAGKLIEAGWIGCRMAWVPENAPPEQVREMRLAYMAGAQHLFSSMMNMFDPGTEPTDADYTRMELIANELNAFYHKELVTHLPAKGNA